MVEPNIQLNSNGELPAGHHFVMIDCFNFPEIVVQLLVAAA
jgi:hypothetical protein